MENNIPKITIYGTTIYIDVIEIELEEGPCLAYTFQDLINKNYIIALTCGDIFKLDTIYSRIHSSCITSETFCSLDCDCSNQAPHLRVDSPAHRSTCPESYKIPAPSL